MGISDPATNTASKCERRDNSNRTIAVCLSMSTGRSYSRRKGVFQTGTAALNSPQRIEAALNKTKPNDVSTHFEYRDFE